MANGKTHEKVNIMFFAIAIVLSFIVFNFTVSIYTAFFSIGYWIGTYYMNPDLDIKSKPYNRWKALRFIWIPYQKMFKHRSVFTHGIILGDIIRYLYLFIYITLTYILISMLTAHSFQDTLLGIYGFLSGNLVYVFFLFIGSCGSSFSHVLADHATSEFKKAIKR